MRENYETGRLGDMTVDLQLTCPPALGWRGSHSQNSNYLFPPSPYNIVHNPVEQVSSFSSLKVHDAVYHGGLLDVALLEIRCLVKALVKFK